MQAPACSHASGQVTRTHPRTRRRVHAHAPSCARCARPPLPACAAAPQSAASPGGAWARGMRRQGLAGAGVPRRVLHRVPLQHTQCHGVHATRHLAAPVRLVDPCAYAGSQTHRQCAWACGTAGAEELERAPAKSCYNPHRKVGVGVHNSSSWRAGAHACPLQGVMAGCACNGAGRTACAPMRALCGPPRGASSTPSMPALAFVNTVP